MAVPTGDYISDLDATKPNGATEDANLVDDWLKYIQKCVKQSFPNITGEVTATHSELNALASSGVSATEMAYLNGVTSAVQTQLDAKADLVTGATNGNLAGLDASGNLADSGVPASDVTQNTDTDISGNGWVDTDVSNNLSTKVPTEAAVKAYVDAQTPNIASQLFTSSGTFTVPAGVTTVKVIVVGGGGGGSGASSSSSMTSGRGGRGGLAIGVITVTSSEVITVTVGAGGDASNTGDGSAGGASSFGTYVSATGGAGGIYGGTNGANGVGSVDASHMTINTGASDTSPFFGRLKTRTRGTGIAGVVYDPTSDYVPGCAGDGEGYSTASDAAGGVGGMVFVEYVA